MTLAAPPRVVMVALDALESTLLEHLFESGALPNLARFAHEAGRAAVRSDGLVLHGSIWPTFASGANPGVHGKYFWTQWVEEEMGHARSSHPALEFDPFWSPIAAAGFPVTAIDPPYVPLVRRPGVLQISGWGVHDELLAEGWPLGSSANFRKRFGKHPLEFDTVEPQRPTDKLKMVRDMRRGVELRARAVETLLRERPGPGFHLFNFAETHKAGHYLAAAQQLSESLTNVTAMANLLEPLDRAWPAILDAAGPDAHVFLFALHGMFEQVDYSGALGNQVLALALGKEPEAAVRSPDLLRRIRDLLPDSVHRAIWRRLPGRFRAARQGALSTTGADLEHDPIFPIVHDGHLAIRKNFAGRERDGRISDAEAEDALQALAVRAAEFALPDGRPAFGGLYRLSDHFTGPRLHRLPDAFLLANHDAVGASRIIGPGGRELFNADPEARNGVHNGHGFLYLRPASHSTATLARPAVDNLDFAASILDLFGLQRPPQAEGTSFFA